MSTPTNPDVDELVRRNRETCDHPLSKRVLRNVSVGAGWPMIGSHMEQRWFCSGCDKPADDPAIDAIIERLKAARVSLPDEPEPACACAGDDDAPIGGHRVRCPRYGRRPL